MALLIDGYNLLHVTGIFGGGKGPGGFQRSRHALVRFVVATTSEVELRDATIVFDAADAPPGLPSHDDYEGLQIRYAQGYPDADTLLEELIARHPAPRTLTVVSSDHRVQRAARRRKAHAVDSERWYADRLAERRRQENRPGPEPSPRDRPLNAAEVEYWLAEFSAHPADAPPDSTQELAASQDDITNPFPPGYGEDLLEEDP